VTSLRYAVLAAISLSIFGHVSAAAAPVGSVGHGSFGIRDAHANLGAYAGGASGAQSPVRTTVFDCGAPTLSKRSYTPASRCGHAWLQCDVEKPSLVAKRPVTDLLVVSVYSDGSVTEDVDCNVPTTGQKVRELKASMVRDQARRLLPHPMIGSAPPGHVTLVNIETVLWVNTAPERQLGTVNLLGRRVDIRARTSIGLPGTSATTRAPRRTARARRTPTRILAEPSNAPAISATPTPTPGR